jgi:hypothetical protein
MLLCGGRWLEQSSLGPSCHCMAVGGSSSCRRPWARAPVDPPPCRHRHRHPLSVVRCPSNRRHPSSSVVILVLVVMVVVVVLVEGNGGGGGCG